MAEVLRPQLRITPAQVQSAGPGGQRPVLQGAELRQMQAVPPQQLQVFLIVEAEGPVPGHRHHGALRLRRDNGGRRRQGRRGPGQGQNALQVHRLLQLAGQPVQFKVKCVEVKEKKVPAIDDEFAKDVSEFETLAEFKEDLKQKIVDRNMAQSEAKFRQALLAQLCEQVDIELPEAMVETQIDRLMDSYASRLEQQG